MRVIDRVELVELVVCDVHQLRDLCGQLISDKDHSATKIRSIDFAGLLEGMEDIRLASRNPGATIVRLFRVGILDEYGPGSQIDRLLAQYLTNRSAAGLVGTDNEAQLLLRLVVECPPCASEVRTLCLRFSARI